MATTILPQLQPQSSSLASPTSETTPTEVTGLLSRTWVPPPRPKPGRKPATDTPPSKRKAQNRLAQRNFRERRAAKVNELEDQMKEVQAEHDAEIEELNAGARQLKSHLALLESTLQSDRVRLHAVQTELDRERSMRQTLEKKLARAEEELAKAGVVPLTRRRPGDSNRAHTNTTSACEKCTLHTCTCLNALEQSDSMQGIEAPKRPSSPREDSSITSKRPRIDTLLNPNSNSQNTMSMEIDLTTRPKFTSAMDTTNVLATSGIPIDSCGFCDNNPDVCLCRNKDGDATDTDTADTISRAIPALTRPTGCSGRPGSCKQCQDDPRSARFCKSFARTHTPPLESSSTAKSPVSGGCGMGASCCQIQQPTSHMRTGSLSEKLSALNTSGAGGNAGGSTLDCAAAYRRLQSHPKFDEAMNHVDDWTSQLRPPPAAPTTGLARPEVVRKESLEGRTPYEIEAASVMSTLKYFDSKFGSETRGEWRHQN